MGRETNGGHSTVAKNPLKDNRKNKLTQKQEISVGKHIDPLVSLMVQKLEEGIRAGEYKFIALGLAYAWGRPIEMKIKKTTKDIRTWEVVGAKDYIKNQKKIIEISESNNG